MVWFSEHRTRNLVFCLISAGSILEVNPKFIDMNQTSLFLSLLAYFTLAKVVPSVTADGQRERIVQECTVPSF